MLYDSLFVPGVAGETQASPNDLVIISELTTYLRIRRRRGKGYRHLKFDSPSGRNFIPIGVRITRQIADHYAGLVAGSFRAEFMEFSAMCYSYKLV